MARRTTHFTMGCAAQGVRETARTTALYGMQLFLDKDFGGFTRRLWQEVISVCSTLAMSWLSLVYGRRVCCIDKSLWACPCDSIW